MDLQHFKSVNQEAGGFGVSEKYGFIPTTRVINALEGAGWYPSKAQESRVVKASFAGYQKHMVRFRQAGTASLLVKDAVYPEIVLTNSHDGLASFQIMAGLFRLICLNGMVIADAMFGTHRIKHLGYTDAKVKMAVEQIADTVPQIAAKVKDYDAIELSEDERGVFAMAALTVKYGEEHKRAFDVPRLLRPKRYEDKPPTLWNTYNGIQEQFIKGGRYEVNQRNHQPKKARGTTSISEDIRINRGLWLLAEEMAKLKGASA